MSDIMPDSIMPWRFPDRPIEVSPDIVEALKEPEWQASAKGDGWNSSIYVDDKRAPHIFSSSGRKLGEVTNVPFFLVEQLAEMASKLEPLSVFNAEFMGPRGGHQPSFTMFDCLAWKGEWLSLTPFKQRWDITTSEIGSRSTAGIQLVETADTDFMVLFNKLKQIWYDGGCTKLDANEGIVLKRWTGDLTLNRNSSSKNRHQFKLKYREILEERY